MKKIISKFLAIIIVFSIVLPGNYACQATSENTTQNTLIKNKKSFVVTSFFYNIFPSISSNLAPFMDYFYYLGVILKDQNNFKPTVNITNDPIATFVSNEKLTIKILALAENEDIFSWPIELFERKYPNINIEIRVISDEEIMWNELISNRNDGTMPDIFMIKDSWINSYWSLISPAPKDLFNTDEIKKTYYPMISEAFFTETKIWAIPIFIDSLAMFYNANLLKDDRITVGDKPAGVWEGFIENSESFKYFTKDKKSFFTIDNEYNIKNTFNLFKALILQSSISTEDKLANNPELIEILKFLAHFYSKSSKKKSNLEKFTNGEVSLIFGNQSDEQTIGKIISENLRKNITGNLQKNNFNTTTIPQLSSDNKNAITLGESWGFAVSPKSINVNTSWAIIAFLTSEENTKDLALKTGKTPGRIGIIDGFFPQNALIAKSAKDWDNYEFMKIFEENFTSLVSNKITVEEATTNFDEFFENKR